MIGTQGGKILLKDGKVQRGCECCGLTCESNFSNVQSVVVTISASSEYVFQREDSYSTTQGLLNRRTTILVFPGQLHGTHVLSKVATADTYTDWSISLSGQPVTCTQASINLRLQNVPRGPNAAYQAFGSSLISGLLHWSLDLKNLAQIRKTSQSYSGSGCPEPQFYDPASVVCDNTQTLCLQSLTAYSNLVGYSAVCSDDEFISHLPVTVTLATPQVLAVSGNLLSSTTNVIGSNSIAIESVEVIF